MRFLRRKDDSQKRTAFNRYVAEDLTARLTRAVRYPDAKTYYIKEVSAVAQRAFLLATILGLLRKELVLALLESASSGGEAKHLQSLLAAEVERRLRHLGESAAAAGTSYYSLFPEDKPATPEYEGVWLHDSCIELFETRVHLGLVLGDVDKVTAQALLASSGLDTGYLEKEALRLATAWFSHRQ